MTKKILIDAAHSEETRVAVLENGILQDFDREAISVKQIKGNIYLAKITKVEPSLQAAFVDYGSDRHGFLPLSDIHPDYYNIVKNKISDLGHVKHFAVDNVDEIDKKTNLEDGLKSVSDDEESDDSIKEVDEVQEPGHYSKYKIQDVLKEGQYVLVQVLKEERGNKGVALTTHISLAGKYCVLMANSMSKGGVSKKVNNLRDRKILKNILRNLNIPKDKSIIIRTAGVGKKPEEILRDYIYLMKLWNTIKQAAIDSKAPAFIHAEDDIIKRAIRDIKNEELGEIIIEGKEAYISVKNLVKLVFSSNKIKIRLYNDKTPIFHKYNVEPQIMSLYNNKVSLPSGASIVIDQTEALVAIDVNSGGATKEKSVEEMAVTINIEAAKEIARQLKLRDLAGLVVIDFIDMFDLKNRRTVERAMRDALESDRARIQTARLSIFGLMEMSRQRLSGSLINKVSSLCPRCNGSGMVKSKEIVAMNIIRAIRHAATEKNTKVVYIFTSNETVLYILNYKRNDVKDLEAKYNIYVFLQSEENIDGDFYVRRRRQLTKEEKSGLFPRIQNSKVNLAFDSEFLSDIKEEEGDYNFQDNCHFNQQEPKKKFKHHKKPYYKKKSKKSFLRKLLDNI